MILKIHKREDPYARIDNRVLSDCRLSYRARGLLAYLLSKPNDWKARSEDIIAHGTEGRDAIRTAFKELRVFGYARLEESRGENGKVFGKEWVVTEEPKDGFPVGGLLTEKPKVGKPAHIVTKDKSTNERLSSKDSPTKKDKPFFEHKIFTDGWSEAYSKHFGDTYAFQGGKDGAAIKSLLAATKLPPADLIAIAVKAWLHGGFYCKGATSIAGFNSKFNEIRQELKTNSNGTNQKPHIANPRIAGTALEGTASQYRGVGKIR